MAKNIEAQGIRVGYIIGGILAILLAALLIIMYFPSFLAAAFGIAPLWDLYTPIADLVGDNFIQYFETWGAAGIMTLFFLIYFVCMAARQSKSSTMFRLTGLFGALGCALPFAVSALNSMNIVDLSGYVSYAIMGTFVLALIFYITGLVLRGKQKFHKNRASTTLVFCVTFWLLLSTLFAVYYIGLAFNIETLVTSFEPIIAFAVANIFTILAIYLLISAIWLFCTVPHRIRVEYNANTPQIQKPTESVAEQANNIKLSPEEEAAAKQRSTEAIKGSGAPVTQPVNVYPNRQNRAMPNPYKRKPIQPVPISPQVMPQRFNNQIPQNSPLYGTAQNSSIITPQNSYNQNYQNQAQNLYPRGQNQTQNYQPAPINQQARPLNTPYTMPAKQPQPTQNPNGLAIQTPQQIQTPRPMVQTPQFPRPQPIRPAAPNTPNFAPNFYNPTAQQQNRPPFPQQPNVANNPNNYIPNNIRPTNNGNNTGNGQM